ncbi:hypothetical protein BP6252_09329 [Coleophoma cylindrospora]|uniref:Aminoglycoside phosphotransferase domain-containing protein n=1 Tax=Coleophoma cylindrospora TaxID=1849047 RepID=A0A3D8R1L3_9HELO|nr:hypothetical protein BP6252_09329 [Coleophoma cylindrospora]
MAASATTSRAPRPPILTSLMYSLPIRRLKEILSHINPQVTLGPVEEIPSTQLARLYALTMSDGRRLLLSYAPSLSVRLLRQEATLLSSEATLVQFITDEVQEASLKSSLADQSRKPPSILWLATLVPKLLKHSSNNREMAYPYSIYEPTSGAPLSTLSVYMSVSERRLIDKQIGVLARVLASLVPPDHTFGTVGRVLSDPSATGLMMLEPTGSSAWPAAFNSLLEGILRDGEDMSVLLPYDAVRSHNRRLSWRLEAVATPRLIILGTCPDMNVMIERGEESSSGTTKLTGLRSWSQGYFGDPLLSSCWEDPSEGFLEGWNDGGEDIIEDPDNAGIRMLLYKCYAAIVSIVTEYYRPQAESSRRELEGRRKLTSALAELERIEAATAGLKRTRSASAEVEDSKRPKLEESET